LYYGNRVATGQHSAPAGNFFLQIANTKTWRFVGPRYTPYMKPMRSVSHLSMVSGHAYVSNSSRIPYTDVTVEAGDLVLVPPSVWHEVHNVHPEFGLATGFRPRPANHFFKWMLFPWTAPPGQFMHKFLCIPGQIIPRLLGRKEIDFRVLNKGDSKTLLQNSKKAGLFNRMQRLYPGWNMAKHDLGRYDIVGGLYKAEDAKEWRTTFADILKTEL